MVLPKPTSSESSTWHKTFPHFLGDIKLMRNKVCAGQLSLLKVIVGAQIDAAKFGSEAYSGQNGLLDLQINGLAVYWTW